jgi:1-acyl-sn-glycerol-3-phosphate acyltransferase
VSAGVAPRAAAGAGPGGDPSLLRAFDRVAGPWLRGWHRIEAEGAEKLAAAPASSILVFNHNAGFALDLFAMNHVLRPWTWDGVRLFALGRGAHFQTPGLRTLIARVGGVPSSTAVAGEILRDGGRILLSPGGEREIFRPVWERNRVRFGWQRDYVRLAQTHRVPIYPIAISGSHEAVPILGGSRFLWRWLPGYRRMYTGATCFPFTLYHLVYLVLFLLTPWSRSVPAWAAFLVGSLYLDLLTFLPWLPAKLRVRVGDPIRVPAGGTPGEAREAVEAGHRRVVGALEGMLADIHRRRPWPRFLV